MRYSHQRETIKKVVYGTDSHPTAEWVFRKTKNFIPKISLGTVYRNLKVLAEMGQLSVINDDNISRYDWNTNSHNHLKCKQCDSLIDIQLVNDGLISNIKKQFKFDVDDVEITIIGTCSKHIK